MAIPPQQLVTRLDTLPGLFMHQRSDAQRRAMWGELVNAGNNSGVAERMVRGLTVLNATFPRTGARDPEESSQVIALMH